MGVRLSKSSKYIDKLFKKQRDEQGIDIEKFNKKIKEDGSIDKDTFIFQDYLYVDFSKMKKSHVEVTERNMERFKIKSATELLGKASEKLPKHKLKASLEVSGYEDHEYMRLSGVDYAEQSLEFPVDHDFEIFKASSFIHTRGMNYAIYQIRGYGVDKKNQPKFDKLYKEVASFFILLRKHKRRYFTDHLDKLSNEYRRAKEHLTKAIDMIGKSESKSISYLQKYGANTDSFFARKVIMELYNQIGVLDYLRKFNDNEKTIKGKTPNDSRDLGYFYYLCWTMYQLIDDSKFTIPKNENQKLFSDFVYYMQGRFIDVISKSNTYDNLRKNKTFKKLKYLDLQSITTEAIYNNKFEILFGKQSST